MKFKRILSILLSVAMIVSMCVIPASAAEPYIYISPNVNSGFLKSLLIFLFRAL